MRRLAIALMLLPAIALAAPGFVPDGPTISVVPYGIESANYVCLPGNPYTGTTLGYYNIYFDTQSYAVLIDPAECPTCDLGFAFSRVRMLLRLTAGAAFQVSASIADAVEAYPGCYAPGAVQASSGAAAVSGIATTGGYFISLNWASPCIDPRRPYFLIFSFPDLGTGLVGPYVDVDGIANCQAYRDAGAGWIELASGGFAGDPQIWAETDCCSPPIADEDASWGRVKSLFR